MSTDVYQIIKEYTTGVKELADVNEELKEAGAGFHLEPGKNEITEEDRRETFVGYYPYQANGWGLLDTGTGSLEKVHVFKGKLDAPVNEILPTGKTNMSAYVTICGKRYEVLGNTLAEIPDDCEACKVPPLPVKPDMGRRSDLAGKTVEQRTKTGIYMVTYDEQGYAVKSSKKEIEK